MRGASLALGLPIVLVGSPVITALIFRWAGGHFFEKPELGFFIGLALGLFIGVRETVRIIRQISRISQEEDDSASGKDDSE
ncbi:MAG: hypothetical protein RLY93_03995 [Sumerlaeia bacterium]